MDLSGLSDYQLYEIIQNATLSPTNREAANKEFTSRRLSVEEVRQLIAKHDSLFTAPKEEGLKINYKFLLMFFPFIIEIHTLIAGRMLAKGRKRQWKEYWLYICLGYLLWMVVVVLFAKYKLLTEDFRSR